MIYADQIGEPLREIEVIPLEEPDPSRVPQETPAPEPIREPEKVPA